MIKMLFLIMAIFLVTNACDRSNGLSDQRRILMGKVVNAIFRHDTAQLYDLVDTGFCFSIYRKEGFLQKVNYVYNRFKLCGDSINDTNISVKHTRVKMTEYSIPFFCNGEIDERANSFKLLLSFADDQDDGKILYFDYAVKNPIKTLAPVPGTASKQVLYLGPAASSGGSEWGQSGRITAGPSGEGEVGKFPGLVAGGGVMRDQGLL